MRGKNTKFLNTNNHKLIKLFKKNRFKKKLLFPIPGELIVVITGTLISYFVQFKNRWNVAIIGEIPSGFFFIYNGFFFSIL